MSGYITTEIPGGEATWYTRISLPPRRERMVQVEGMPLRHIVEQIRVDDSYPVSREDAIALLALNELSVVVFLKSWTLTDATGQPLPIPTTSDEVLDLDKPLYDALLAQAAKLYVQTPSEDFTIDAIENPDSPIGDLGA